MYPTELEEGAKGGQRDCRSFLHSGGRTGSGGEVALDPAPTGTGAHPGPTAGAGRGSSSRRGSPGTTALAGTESRSGETGGSHRVRTCFGARPEGRSEEHTSELQSPV